MGRDKAFIEIDGLQLWQRQIALLRSLHPTELMISGPSRLEWEQTAVTIVADEHENAGPLAGIAAALRRSSTPLLLVLAVDLPKMTAAYLRDLVGRCTDGVGIVPMNNDRFEPVAAVYPARVLPLAEELLRNGRCSLQDFARQSLVEKLVHVASVSCGDEMLFANMNTPGDLLIAAGRTAS